MSDDLTLRLARPGDIAAVVARAQSAYRGGSGRLGWTSEGHLLGGQRTDAAAVAEMLARSRSRIVLAEQGDHLVGCCHLEVKDDGGWFGLLSVDPRRQAGGVGRRLVGHVEGVAHDDFGASQMSLQVIDGRVELIAWYERLGYRLTGEATPFPEDERFGVVRGAPLRFVVMRKALTPSGDRKPGQKIE